MQRNSGSAHLYGNHLNVPMAFYQLRKILQNFHILYALLSEVMPVSQKIVSPFVCSEALLRYFLDVKPALSMENVHHATAKQKIKMRYE